MNENKQESFQSKNEAEIRLKKLGIAIDTIKSQFNEDEKQKIKAIILFGSTARGIIKHPDADIDIHIDLDPYDDGVFKKIVDIMNEQVSGIDLSFTAKNIIPGGKMAKLITAQKYPDQPSQWKFLYSRSDQEESNLDAILFDKQRNKSLK